LSDFAIQTKRRRPVAIIITTTSEQPLKQSGEILPSDEGTQMHRSEEQCENAKSQRVEMAHPDSNVTFDRFRHSWKQYFEMVSSDEGMQID
jgi:hypothetical protein